MAVTEKTLATFDGSNGEYPLGGLLMDGAGDLFGVTQVGVTTGNVGGTVFELSASSGQLESLYSFDTSTNGAFPFASLTINLSGTLYGTTSQGGINNDGTVFALAPVKGTYTYAKLADLGGSTGSGSDPMSGVYVASDGTIYGTTSSGGSNGTGTVFTLQSGSSTPSYTSFPAGNPSSGTDYGPEQISPPVLVGTSLYGTTTGDGMSTNLGTIFAFNTQTSTLSAVASFNATTGARPTAGVIADSAGNLYGTTTGGGANGDGTIYEYDKATGSLEALASFSNATGFAPEGSLLRDANGDLFGTTINGGADGGGAVFELKAGASTITDLYNFTGGTDGESPFGSLVADKSGNLYGTAYAGGTGKGGTIFEISGTDFAPICFASGTLIRTVQGDVAIEALEVGDRVVTASGATRPVYWLGHRALDCRRHTKPREAMPIRVAAHAFGQNRPTRDLHLSPGHSVCVDVVGGVLVPVGRLVNGATIKQLDVDTVTYWHVELESHDILLAENLACESYIDCGTRAFFAESDVVALGASPDAPALTTDDYCRPFKPEGALVDMLRDRLCLRAADLGWRLAIEDELAGLWLEVDGARIDPARHGLLARATLPANAREVRLRSASGVPADIFGDRDERRLGLQLASLVIDDGLGCRREIACTDERLADGFQPHEGTHRWTDGDARLPAALWEGCRDSFHLRLAFAGPALPRWVAPAEAGVAAARDVAA